MGKQEEAVLIFFKEMMGQKLQNEIFYKASRVRQLKSQRKTQTISLKFNSPGRSMQTSLNHPYRSDT